MAIIQYTGIVNQIRGKLNGSVFNKSRNGYTLQRKPQPTQGRSGLQSRRRAVFAQAQRRWKDLTPVQQNQAQISANNNPTRDRFGEQVVLSGYNHFVKANVMSLLSTQQFLDNMLPDSAEPYNYILAEGSFSLFPADGGHRFHNQIAIIDVFNVNLAGLTFFFYVSVPLSSGITKYSGRWFLGGSLYFTSSGPSNGYEDLEFPNSLVQNYPIAVPGQRALVRLDAWDIKRGALVNSQFISMLFE